MSSPKQIEANRRNALKSTGPTTPEGKERSRRNAVRHGLTAETVIAALEDSDDYQTFEAAVIADYEAETAIERELVLRLASALWRLRRATAIETGLFDSVTEKSRLHKNKQAEDFLERNRVLLNTVLEPGGSMGIAASLDSKKHIAESFMRLTALPTCPLDRLSRYEYMLWRQARQIVMTLESARRCKRARRHVGFPFSFRASGP
jgi:hypothetical protein